MFGGNDSQGQQNDGGDAQGMPAPDAAVAQDGDQPAGAPPSAPQMDTPTNVNDTAGEYTANDEPATPAAPGEVPAPSASAGVDDLLNIKQQALQQLSPLLGHLDQTPEERFRTTMMMIQASDDDGLLQHAYDAATQITDEKVRAQALLDVVNEINYFTQHGGEADGPQ
jgi:hypothetical protein